jgi:hypothetical protein
MAKQQQGLGHSAEAAALGFYYQTFFALMTLMRQETDNAAVGIEQLDDVHLKVDGHNLLYQLKHSISDAPPAISLKSKGLWKTVKIWVDILPDLTLSETTLHLVTVAKLGCHSPLFALTDLGAKRTELVEAMVEEAQRVIDARAAAGEAGKALPHADRVDGCLAFLSLTDTERHNLMCRTVIQSGSTAVGAIEDNIAGHLKLLPPEQRPAVAMRLIEWWDRQIVYSLCGKRERTITRGELQHQISAIVSDIEQEKLVPDFELASPPKDYQPDGMLARQVEIVDGKTSDLAKAIREEWKAREQRSKWLNGSPAMAATINDYDIVLQEHWSDRHSQMAEECAELDQKGKCQSGLKILRWTHEDAPITVRPIAQGWGAAYYVRGSYQVLAIDLKVGWHADYARLLGGAE